MPSLISMLQVQMVRELQSFIREVEACSDDTVLWEVRPGVTNAVGNLALHVSGNLQHFVGHHLGKTGYVRQRDREFGTREGTRAQVVGELQTAIGMLATVMPSLSGPVLEADFPEQVGGQTINTAQFLLHLAAHLSFHLGQAGYLRRLVAGDNTSTGPMPLKAIARQ